MEAFIHGHPQLFRRFAALDYVTGANSYLELQTNQLTRDELLLMARCEGLIEEQHRFHVAPRFLRWVERSELIGMMLLGVFRKPASDL